MSHGKRRSMARLKEPFRRRKKSRFHKAHLKKKKYNRDHVGSDTMLGYEATYSVRVVGCIFLLAISVFLRSKQLVFYKR